MKDSLNNHITSIFFPPAAPLSIKLISGWLMVWNALSMIGVYLAYKRETYQGNFVADMLNGVKVEGRLSWYTPVLLYSLCIFIEGVGIRYLKKWAWIILFLDTLYTIWNHLTGIIHSDFIGLLINSPNIITYILVFFVYKHRKLFS